MQILQMTGEPEGITLCELAFRGELNLCAQVWSILFLLVRTTFASTCLKIFCNLEMVVQPGPVSSLALYFVVLTGNL